MSNQFLLYFVINGIIITIAASSRFHQNNGENEKTEELMQQQPRSKILVEHRPDLEYEMKSSLDFNAVETVVYEQKEMMEMEVTCLLSPNRSGFLLGEWIRRRFRWMFCFRLKNHRLLLDSVTVNLLKPILKAKWLNKQLSKLWPFVAEVHTLAFCSGVLDSLAVELKASKDFSKLYAGIAILWLHISLNQPSVIYCFFFFFDLFRLINER